MVIDTSAMVAILRLEPEADAFLRAMATAGTCAMSGLSVLETSMVLTGTRGAATSWTPLDDMISVASIEVVAFDRAQANAAREAFLRFGKGRDPAGLNLGDCASYALAVSRGEPLLFKGSDFGKTDVAIAAS